MKTLDEVIEAIEVCRDSYVAGKIIKSDALHYLKEYQRYQNTPSRSGHMALVDYFEESQKNEPLTWDELKSMEGKPVWVEFFFEDGQHFVSDWFLVYSVSESFCDVAGKLGISRLVKNDYWQAYRKERENDVG